MLNQSRIVDGLGLSEQKIHRYPNGYGASVVRTISREGYGTYGHEQGLWELCTIAFTGPGVFDWWRTPFTGLTNLGSVEGWLSEEEVETFLREIAALPSQGTGPANRMKHF